MTGRALAPLAALRGLRTLHLQHQKLTDADVPALARLAGLRRVMLGQNRLTEAGLAALRRALPECDVNTVG